MPKVLFLVTALFVVLTSSFVFGQPLGKSEDVPDDVFYTYLFYRLGDSQTNSSLFEDVKSGALLTGKQTQTLRKLVADYSSAFPNLSKKEKLRLALLYRGKLKADFGINKFKIFDNFAKAKFSAEIVYFSNAPSAFLGSVAISIIESTHTLQGQAGIVFNDSFDGNLNAACSVNAVMSGPNVSQSGSMSSDCEVQTPSVTLTDTGYVGGSQYCITGNFTGVSGPTSKTACVNAPQVPHIASVTYERPNSGDLPIDFNPNTGDGFRIFPDKNLPAESIDRRRILIRAKYNQAVAGTRIYFRSFDVDDPSAASAPIDVETTLNAGNDNNGTVDGTSATKAGKFVIPQSPNPFDCQTFTNGVSCLTNANGEVAVEFLTTTQPGDNFTVAAGLSDTYLNGLSLGVDGINLKDSNNVQIPVTTRNSNANECLTTAVAACRADMLTVWRRLHIEVDSMGNVAENKIQGTMAQNRKVRAGRVAVKVAPNPDVDLQPNRFENGRMIIDGRSYPVVADSAGNSNTIDTVTIRVKRPFVITTSTSFTLYDDDDFDGMDGEELDGDNLPLPGEDIVENEDILSWFQASSNPEENRLAIAYIVPDYSWAISNNFNESDATFHSNVPDDGVDEVIDEKRDSGNLENNNFWVAYLLFSYQGEPLEDRDPITEPATGGIARSASLTDGPIGGGPLTVPYGSDGALIYLEAGRDFDVTYDEDFAVRKTIVPHEIGHQFGLKGDDVDIEFGMMSSYALDLGTNFNPVFVPRHINVLRRRVASPGKLPDLLK